MREPECQDLAIRCIAEELAGGELNRKLRVEREGAVSGDERRAAVLTGEDAERSDHECQELVSEAIHFAEESPEPRLDELYENVFS